jgi:hypothetical protein
MKHYANPITGRHKAVPDSPAKYNADLAMGERAMRDAGAVKPIAYSSTEQAAEPADEVFGKPIEAKELTPLVTAPTASDKIKRTVANPLLT